MSDPTLPLSCRCGALRGSLQHPPAGIHVVCYCDDCQTYARALGQSGLLDAHGGTDIFQTSPSAVRLEVGADRLALMRLSPKGLFRWYAACCQTPVANTLGNPRVPFVGVVTAFIALSDEAKRDTFGPAVGIQARFARGGKPPGAYDTAPLSTLWQTGSLMLRGLLTGRHQPSPFFDPSTGQPRATARVLSLEERTSYRPSA